MRAILRSVSTPFGDDPSDIDIRTDDFAQPLELFVGVDQSPGEEVYQLTVCSVAFLAGELRGAKNRARFGRGLLIVAKWDWPEIYQEISDAIGHIHAESVEALYGQVDRFAISSYE